MRQVAFTIDGETAYTYDTWGILLAHVDFGFPEVKGNFITIDGRDGDLDLTDSLDGMAHYENRQVFIEFMIPVVPYGGYLGKVSQVATFLHGKKAEVVFDADKGYKFIGRCSVEAYDREINVGKFSVVLDCEPFKVPVYGTDSEWIWDTFDFVNGVLGQDGSGEVSNNNQTNVHEFEVIGKPVKPTFTAICDKSNTNRNLQVSIRNIDTNEIISTKSFVISNTEITDLLDDDFKGNGKLRMTVMFYPQSSGQVDDVITYSYNVTQGGVL